MNYIALVGALLNAFDHPPECTEPAPGEVEGNSSVSLDGVPVAALNLASMEFPPHPHEYDSENDNCISISSHSIQPDPRGYASSVTIDNKNIYLDDTNVSTDPGSGGPVDVVNNGGNSSVIYK